VVWQVAGAGMAEERGRAGRQQVSSCRTPDAAARHGVGRAPQQEGSGRQEQVSTTPAVAPPSMSARKPSATRNESATAPYATPRVIHAQSEDVVPMPARRANIIHTVRTKTANRRSETARIPRARAKPRSPAAAEGVFRTQAVSQIPNTALYPYQASAFLRPRWRKLQAGKERRESVVKEGQAAHGTMAAVPVKPDAFMHTRRQEGIEKTTRRDRR